MNWLREPLLHFAVVGAALFAAYAFVNRGTPAAADDTRVVRVTSAQADWLRQGFARQWGRPPTQAEVRGLLADHVREELLAREALALGLQDGDTVVRRRLAQKMDFLVEDAAAVAEPTDAELAQTYEAHRREFALPPRVSLTQIYFSRERRGARATADAAAAVARLRGDARRGALDAGDPTMLPATLTAQDEPALAAQFGPAFARRAFTVATNVWQGPIESSFGVHAIRVTERVEPDARSLADVRSAVVTLWRDERRKVARDAHIVSLMKKYDVAVDKSVLPFFDAGAVRAVADK